MHNHHEKCDMPFTLEQLFDLVIDIESYPEFLPWCSAARILTRNDNILTADLAIRFKAFSEKYTSKVIFNRPTIENPEGYIIVELIEGPFSHLKNIWKFIPRDDGGSILDFYIDFTFKNKMLDMVAGMMFAKAQAKMVKAFMVRAKSLYSVTA